ncbi:hypothetical protein NC652_031308 [Populus alba x Populus x berolinensis]|uniref:Uncharacterized protein n=1 Tax=Populus alba x Populus x berolinensis TaxID=444605 RepID=A0AAD6M0G1_9ROSI|nr:hypothetical protein NC652_031308 [Populus alba x Populus x berolinensis]KAJ6975167.1 hypothetical protein NC653_031117 [Populus alba x Populus x berolinensis]
MFHLYAWVHHCCLLFKSKLKNVSIESRKNDSGDLK